MPRHAPDEQALLRNLTHALGSGDATAVNRTFETIYHAYVRTVAFVCARYLSDDTDIRSVTDDVFVRFFQRVAYLDSVESLRAYLTESARNASLDRLRAQRRREAGLTDPIGSDGETDLLTLIPDPDGDVTASVRYTALTDDLRATVGDETAEIILAHAVCGESFPAIAARLGKKENTVKTVYHRAIKKFRLEKGDRWL